MKRNVLFIPTDQLHLHFGVNDRQDIKIVAPEILTRKLLHELLAQGRKIKPEQILDGDRWEHAEASEANNLVLSKDFADSCLPQYTDGPFAVSFANESAEQDEHYHQQHLEIYFSEYPIGAEYRLLNDVECKSVHLESGGMIIFAPEVVHKMQLGGLTVVIEVPAVANDKIKEMLVCDLRSQDAD